MTGTHPHEAWNLCVHLLRLSGSLRFVTPRSLAPSGDLTYHEGNNMGFGSTRTFVGVTVTASVCLLWVALQVAKAPRQRRSR